jgi:hypothetical protein
LKLNFSKPFFPLQYVRHYDRKEGQQTESSRDQNGKSDKNENREYAQRQDIEGKG